MGLESFVGLLQRANREGWGIPLFDIFEREGTDGIFAAAEAKRAPTIVGTGGHIFDRPGGPEFMGYLVARARSATVPITVYLDHGDSFERCIQALRLGFTDVMFDGSRLPIDENIAITKKVVQAAHAVGAGVEAEIGHVGQGSQYESFGSQREGFTKPDDAERFVAETGVDILAVAIGTAHGPYRGEPKLDYELLAEIHRRLPEIPLVMHGGSGLSDEQFRTAIRTGISKVNIFTDLAQSATAAVQEIAAREHANIMAMSNAFRDAFQSRSEHYLDVFGTSGRA
ncbi:MAG: class II fructose-bisphosphate aldolase [Chloroflexi bacterium]|nr:class II fructose-bisphosphate aldolase [Chloroflexota bacterium]